jgi:lysozyme family protein
MQTIDQIAAEIVAREGGFVNDPDDPGGPTKHGVTLGTLRRLGMDLTGDGKINLADVQHLTQADATRIFVDHYFRKPRIVALPEMLQPSVFDMYVNAGGQAVRILQRLLTDMGFPCTVDGAIWPMPMGLRGATTTTPLPMPARPAANSPVAGMAAKADGSCAPKNSSARIST